MNDDMTSEEKRLRSALSKTIVDVENVKGQLGWDPDEDKPDLAKVHESLMVIQDRVREALRNHGVAGRDEKEANR